MFVLSYRLVAPELPGTRRRSEKGLLIKPRKEAARAARSLVAGEESAARSWLSPALGVVGLGPSSQGADGTIVVTVT